MRTFAILTLLLLAVDLPRQDNFAENPSFELDRNRDAQPDGWQPYAFESPARLDWDDSVSRSGKRSLKISDSFRPGEQRDWKRCTGRWVTDRRPIRPGTKYALEVWIKTQDVTGQGFWPPEPSTKSVMSWMLPAPGRSPVIAEPVRAEVRLQVPGPADVYALDASGKRRERLATVTEAGVAVLNPAAARSIWCEIVVAP